MQIFRAIADIRSVGASVVTVGTFDGVHLGHQAIIQQVKDFAANHSRQSTIVTFDPHPRKVLGKGPVTILTTTAEKLDIFADAGIDQVVVIPFSREFAALSSEAFVTSVLVDKLTVREMVVGYDHHFGRNREGGFEALQQLGRRHGTVFFRCLSWSMVGKLSAAPISGSCWRQGMWRKPHGLWGAATASKAS